MKQDKNYTLIQHVTMLSINCMHSTLSSNELRIKKKLMIPNVVRLFALPLHGSPNVQSNAVIMKYINIEKKNIISKMLVLLRKG